MKKLTKLCFALGMLFAATGCGGNGETPTTPAGDTTLPEILGVKFEASITVQESYEILKGVSASDDVDGDITDKIIYEIYPSYTENIIENDVFTPYHTGEYEIAYHVSDAAGNAAYSKYTTLTVAPGYGPRVQSHELDFSSVDMDGWEYKLGEGVNGTATINKSKLVYKIEDNSVNGEVSLFKNMTLVELTDYELQIVLNSSVAGNIQIDQQATAINEGFNDLKYNFTYKDSAEYKLNIDFASLGNSFEVEVEKIVIKEVSGSEESRNLLENFDLSAQDVAYSQLGGGSEANLTATKDEITFDILKAGSDNGVWQTRLMINTFTSLNPGKYVLSLDIESSQPYQDGFELIFYTGEIEKGLGKDLYGLRLSANEKKTLSMDIELTVSKPEIKFCLQLGHLDAGVTSTTIKVSNVRIIEFTGNKKEVFNETNFMAENIDCFNDNANGGVGRSYYDDGRLVYEIDSFGSYDWHNKLVFKNISLETFKLYTVEIEAKADKEVRANIFMNKMNSDWEPALSGTITFTEETSVISVSMESHVMQNADYELLLQFGELNTFDGAKIEIQNIKIYAQDYIF